MKITVALLALIPVAAWSADDPVPEPPTHQWERVALEGDGARQAKARALKERQFGYREAPPADPLVAVEQPNGELVIEHRPRKPDAREPRR